MDFLSIIPMSDDAVPTHRRRRIDPSKTGTKQRALSVYFYPDEAERVSAAAKTRGISFSAFVVKSALWVSDKEAK